MVVPFDDNDPPPLARTSLLHSPQQRLAVIGDRPRWVVRHLPGVTIGVDEHTGVAAPEGLGRFPTDRGTGEPRLLDHCIDLALIPHVVGEGDTTPSTLVLDDAVFRERPAIPQSDDHPGHLKEDNVVRGTWTFLPTQVPVERSGQLEVANSEGDETETLLHHARI